jgi:hypothetical protein
MCARIAAYSDPRRTEGTETPDRLGRPTVGEREAIDLVAAFFRALDEEVTRAGVLKKQLASVLGLSPSSVTGMFSSGRGGNKTPTSWERVERILRFCWDKRDQGGFPGIAAAVVTRELKNAQARQLEEWKLRHAMLVRDMDRAREAITASQASVQMQVPAVPEVRYSLPTDAAAFTGREEELDRITAVVMQGATAGGVVAICPIGGMPGVGKTALAVHAAHLLRHQFPDRQLVIDLHGYTPGHKPVTSQAALAGLLTATGVDARNLPRDLDGRAALWRDRMAGQRVLLVLDNAKDSAQVAPLLPGDDSCLVLVTSRRHLGDLPGAADPVLLSTLPPGKAWEMFVRLAPRAADGPAAALGELTGLTGGLPLAISLLGRLYALHPAWTLADLTAETRASMLTLTAEADSVAAAFDVSYRHLPSSQRQFFCRLGLNPAPQSMPTLPPPWPAPACATPPDSWTPCTAKAC